jgi:hypothetical protein
MSGSIAGASQVRRHKRQALKARRRARYVSYQDPYTSGYVLILAAAVELWVRELQDGDMTALHDLVLAKRGGGNLLATLAGSVVNTGEGEVLRQIGLRAGIRL